MRRIILLVFAISLLPVLSIMGQELVPLRGITYEWVVEWEDDSVMVTHYYNGAIPPSGTVGELVQSYDGCNWHNKWSATIFSSTLVYCHFVDGQTVETWERYKINEKEYVVIHDSYVYNDPNIKRW